MPRAEQVTRRPAQRPRKTTTADSNAADLVRRVEEHLRGVPADLLTDDFRELFRVLLSEMSEQCS